jgi:all-trans-8'-apo-beta-carotenal 15,15'-oxygenase
MLTLASIEERLFDCPGADQRRATVRAIEGELPPLPLGTWYLNGPAGFDAGSRSHWLDGDGLIRAVTFNRREIQFASRFVRTRKYRDEQRAGRRLYRAFGSGFPGDSLNGRLTGLESPANISVVNHAGRLLALGEQGEPWEIDPVTLETVGPYTAGGALSPVTPFAAHARVDPSTSELFNFGVSFSPERPMLNVFRFDASGHLVMRSRIPLHCSCVIHDFALSPTYAVFYVSPYVLDIAQLRSGSTVMDALTWRPELGTRVLLVDRMSGALVASIPLGRQYSLHTINCHEEDGLVVLDVIEMPRPVYDVYTVPRLFESPLAATPARMLLDPVSGALVRRQTIRCGCAPEFPAIDPAKAMRPCRQFWALGMSAARYTGAKFFDELIAFRWDDPSPRDTYQSPPGVFVGGEPLLVRGDEGSLWVLVQLFDAVRLRSGFAVLAAGDLALGPVAQMWLDSPTPMAFHGTFVPS